MANKETETRILRALQAGPLSVPQLRDRLGVHDETVRNTLKALMSVRAIARTEKRPQVYFIKDKGVSDGSS
jgi:predicted ArsR family transcriptional regulator